MGLFGDDNRQRFVMREKLLSIGDDYWIEDADGNKAFKVDGKAMRVRDTFKLTLPYRQAQASRTLTFRWAL